MSIFTKTIFTKVSFLNQILKKISILVSKFPFWPFDYFTNILRHFIDQILLNKCFKTAYPNKDYQKSFCNDGRMLLGLDFQNVEQVLPVLSIAILNLFTGMAKVRSTFLGKLQK